MKKITTGILFAFFGLSLCLPAAARADQDSARHAAQQHNQKQSRKDVKRMKKEQKKLNKAHKAKHGTA